jgi:hypothetical protein
MMKSDHNDNGSNEVRVELKYCEHCGGLWVRERGAGVVYCDNCQPRVSDLPIPKKKPGKVALPVRPHTAVDDYGVEIENLDFEEEDETEFEAAGGVA